MDYFFVLRRLSFSAFTLAFSFSAKYFSLAATRSLMNGKSSVSNSLILNLPSKSSSSEIKNSASL